MSLAAKFNWRPSSWRTARWFRPIPYRAWELVVMRVLFAVLVFDAYPKRVPTADPEKVVGLARLFSLDWLADPAALGACRWILLAALVLYAIGILYVVSLPIMTFLIIAPATLSNSQGAAHHHLQVLGLVLLAQWIWFTWRALTERQLVRAGWRTQVLNVFYTQQVVVATYVTTAVWKLWKTKFGWIRESKYFPVQLAKTRDAHYYNKLEPAGAEGGGMFGKLDAWFATVTPHLEVFLFAHPNLCRLAIGSGLILELLAFLALIGRRSRLFYGSLLILFHLIIGRIMNLNFEYNIFLLLIFFVNLPWLGMVAMRKLKR